MGKILRASRRCIGPLLSTFILGMFVLGICFIILESRLPDVETLKNVQFQTPLRIYTHDGKLIGEYGEKRRIPVTLDQVPKQLIQAVLATEDQRFFEHAGVDIYGLLRAGWSLIATGNKSQGGSTITMQVARNFFLSRKKTFSRKFNEILLAIKIERELSKHKILELYLNKIYFGNRAYGVAAAAYVYYGKSLDKLNLSQLAMIAGLPKAPSAHNPIKNPPAALKRRNHVLRRMYEVDYITLQQYQLASRAPVTATYHGAKSKLHAPYVAEMVRHALVDHYGNDAYTKGFQIYTGIDSTLQLAANKAVRDALLAYDQRHGYRGPEDSFGIFTGDLDSWQKRLSKISDVNKLEPAIVISVQENSLTVMRKNGELITIPSAGLSWVKKQLKNKSLIEIGDVIRINQLKDYWQLAQIPQVEGALVSLDPKDGTIKALVGGFNFRRSNFNRVVQATRQPGSSFKPFIYSAALAKGYTLASIINDAPIVLDDPGENALWRPQNDTKRFYGPTRLRIGLIRSRNLVSVRLLENINVPYAVQYVSRFGFDPKHLPKTLSLALGSALVTPLEMAAGYAVFANLGHRVTPYLIQRIANPYDHTIYQASPPTVCHDCPADDPTTAKQVITPQVSYLMNIAMQDVIKHGTGRGALVLKRNDLAGKTGTTNDQFDAWFSGYNADLVTTAWVGFDKPRSLLEYGAKAALPMWIDFMRSALKGKPHHSVAQPPGIVSVRINPKTGLLAKTGEPNSIFEYFRNENAPTKKFQKLNSSQRQAPDEGDGIETIF